METIIEIKLNIWYIIILTVERSSRFNFTEIFIFMLNVVITSKEKIVTIRFQWCDNDALGLKLLKLGKGTVSKLFFCTETVFVLNSFGKN